MSQTIKTKEKTTKKNNPIKIRSKQRTDNKQNTHNHANKKKQQNGIGDFTRSKFD